LGGLRVSIGGYEGRGVGLALSGIGKVERRTYYDMGELKINILRRGKRASAPLNNIGQCHTTKEA